MTSLFTPEELRSATLVPAFSWTKEAPLLKVPVVERSPMYNSYGPGCLLQSDTRLYDLAADPGQERPLYEPAREAKMVAHMARAMQATDAPPEVFTRLGLPFD